MRRLSTHPQILATVTIRITGASATASIVTIFYPVRFLSDICVFHRQFLWGYQLGTGILAIMDKNVVEIGQRFGNFLVFLNTRKVCKMKLLSGVHRTGVH